MTDLQELIARLEAATEGSPELDRAIERAIHDSGPYPLTTPGYTRSIDAALTLLPEWASFELTRSAAGPPTFTRCRLWNWHRGPLMIDRDNEWKAEGNRPLPINICIAALKAIDSTSSRGMEG